MPVPPLPLQLEFLGPETLPLLLVLAGLGLSVAEALAPGANFVVLGVALLMAGVVGLLIGPLASPLVLGALVLLFGALSLYGYREFDLYGGKGTAKTSDSDTLTGKFGHVTERVTPTAGEIKLDSGGFNPYYSARSMDGDIPEGTEVMVIDPGGGNVVTVTPVSEYEDEIDRELARGRDQESPVPDESETDAETETN
ncbi:NfeD family protein [Salinigranum halophilum]|jgi:membrane protein implicated in regulation of membrane protease activity|uniref:NfeD family protein n=1 Tax=Salinigranum halophilum TaxID=2565931 RepID=UPI00115DB63B|nr:NfeD family protein [Salinigranum halophilum]